MSLYYSRQVRAEEMCHREILWQHTWQHSSFEYASQDRQWRRNTGRGRRKRWPSEVEAEMQWARKMKDDRGRSSTPEKVEREVSQLTQPATVMMCAPETARHSHAPSPRPKWFVPDVGVARGEKAKGGTEATVDVGGWSRSRNGPEKRAIAVEEVSDGAQWTGKTHGVCKGVENHQRRASAALHLSGT